MQELTLLHQSENIKTVSEIAEQIAKRCIEEVRGNFGLIPVEWNLNLRIEDMSELETHLKQEIFEFIKERLY